jgi:YD repeat-containing protein
VRILFFLPLLAIGQSLYAQAGTNGLGLPSANANFLGKNHPANTNAEVDLYTGSLELSVPVCALASKMLTIPVSVDYSDGRGIQVQEYASQVGLGWQLNAGGSITRVVRGYPDEQPNGYLGNATAPAGVIGSGGQWGKVVANEATNTSTWTSAQFIALTGITSSSLSVPTADGEPDLYYVQTPFFSFQFTFDQYGNAVFSDNSGHQVITTNFDNSSNYTSSSFEVIDDQGNQYYFGTNPMAVETTTTGLFGTGCTFPTTWYLTQIVAFNAQDNIQFNYTSLDSGNATYHYLSSTTYDASGHSNTLNTPEEYIIKQRLVSSIVSPLGEIDFSYSTGRSDNYNASQLNSLVLKAYNPETSSNSTVLQTYTLYHSYFGSPSTDSNTLRLRLDSIAVTGNTTATSIPLTLAAFKYNQTYPLPSRKSLTAVDYWGYNSDTTGPNTKDVSIPPNQSYAMADILDTVRDVTGTSVIISYQLNDYYNGTGNTQVGGMRVTEISRTLPTGESLYATYSYDNSSGNSTGQIPSNSYLDNTWVVPGPLSTITQTLSETPSEYYDLNGNFVGYSSVKATNQNGGYTISDFTNFSNFKDSLNYANVLANGIPDITSSISRAYKRGLLTWQGVYNSAGNLISEDSIPLSGYYSLTSPIQQTGWGYHWANLTFTVTASGYENSYEFQGSSLYWTWVENYRPGQTIHKDHDQLHPANSINDTTNYTYDPINNRLVDSASTRDSKGVVHTQKIYHAEDIENTTGPNKIPMVIAGSAEAASINAFVLGNNTSTVIHSWDNRNGTINQVHDSVATAVNNHLYLSARSSYTSDPANSSNTLVKKQFFTYDPIASNPISSYLVGDSATSVLYGYNSNLPVARIVDASTSNAPTVSISGASVTMPNGTSTTTQTIPFTVVANGTLTISLVWPDLPAAGSNNTASVSYSLTGPPGFVPPVNASICISSNYTCSAYTSTVSSPFACVSGNYVLTITGSQNPEDNLTLFQYTYPGSISGNFTNEFFYEGFEQDGNVTTSAHTGNMSYSGSYTVPFTLPNSRSYLIQWWDYSGSAWVFNQQAYTGSTTLSGQIDDVRVFPKDALMTSYTYNPLVGKTSETDPAGRSTIYQYDGLNRIMTVRDQDNNILKQYDYEYQQCATPTYNTAQSQIFEKNNCSGGLYGSDVIYTVPAGKYSSCTLTGANQLAQNDISYDGQNYANANGTCSSTPPCVAPITVTATALSNVITVSWSYPPGEGTNAYAVYVYNTAGTAVYDSYGDGSPQTINSSAIGYSTTYTVKVISLCGSDPASAPVTVTTGGPAGQTVNLTSAASIPSGFCCFGCSYTTTVYASTPVIGAGTTLYLNSALTEPVSGMVWVFPYTNNPNNYVYKLSGNTVQSSPSTCP